MGSYASGYASNVALGKGTMASSQTSPASVPSNAVDGNTGTSAVGGCFVSGSVPSVSGGMQWWTVDLQGTHAVESVQVA